MHEAFVEPFQFEFMQRALLAGGLAGLVCAVVGSYVVLKGMGFLGDAIAHSSLAGMAVAFRLGGSVLWGAFLWVVPASLIITFISRRTRLHMDSSIGIVYALGFSVGIIVISQESGYTADLFSFLFGNVLGATWPEIAGIGAVAAIVVGLVILLYKELLFAAYDETMAAASGVPVRLVQYLLPLLIGVTTVAAVKTVGVVLVLSLLITPAATARLLARRLPGIMAMAVIMALASVVGGLYVSFHLDWPAGPTIVLFSTGLFALAVVAAPQRGLLWRRRPTATAGAAHRAA